SHVLLSVFALIRERVCIHGLIQLECPQFLAGLRIERAEPAIVCCADEHQAACGRDRPSASGSADILFTRRQTFIESKCCHPGDGAGVRINSPESSPLWLLARGVTQHAPACITNRSCEAVIRAGTIDIAPSVWLRGSVA